MAKQRKQAGRTTAKPSKKPAQKVVPQPNSTRCSPKSGKRKGCCVPRGKAQGKVKLDGAMGGQDSTCWMELPMCPTGIDCIIIRRANQALDCLPIEETVKYVKCDANGFYLANA